MAQEQRPFDILGIGPLAKAADRLAEAGVSAASAFLSRVCLPAAEELGALVQDRVKFWRLANAVAMLKKAEAKYRAEFPQGEASIHPRIMAEVLGEASWVDDETLQGMWADLTVSSCDTTSPSDTNYALTQLLRQMSSAEAKLLNTFCSKGRVTVWHESGLLHPRAWDYRVPELLKDHRVPRVSELDRHLSHMQALGLIGYTWSEDANQIAVRTEVIALELYARCHGFRGPIEHYGMKQRTAEPRHATDG